MGARNVEDPTGSSTTESGDNDATWPSFALETLSLFSPRPSEASTMDYTEDADADRELQLAAAATANDAVTPVKSKKEDAAESAIKPPKKTLAKGKAKGKARPAAGRWSEWWTHKAEFFELKTEKGKNKRIMIRGYYPSDQRWRQLAEV